MNYTGLVKYDTANGEGIRATIFLSGCTRHCKGCFNPETWDFNWGEPFNKEAKEALKEHLKNPQIKGLSILGGEPLDQNINGLQELIDLANYTHSLGKDVWLWTGYCWEEINGYRMSFVKSCNVLIDGPFQEELKDLSLAFRGSTNQRIIDIKQSIKQNKIIKYKENKYK